MKSFVTPLDLKYAREILPYRSPQDLPLSFRLGGEMIRGIPEAYSPRVEILRPDSRMTLYAITGQSPEGLEIRVEYTLYHDFGAAEYLAFFTNRGRKDTPVISNFCTVDAPLPFKGSVLSHGNGDTLREDGYEWFDTLTEQPLTLQPRDGTSCNGAFPYMRLMDKERGVNIAIGWPGAWKAEFLPEEEGLRLRVGQARCHMTLRPGETMRAPRVSFVAFAGDAQRGTNMWRRWYRSHILPRQLGAPLSPKLCMHVFNAYGKPEFTGADEAIFRKGIDRYLAGGLHPDVWWVDAGWYKCDYDWARIGSWSVDPQRFPSGLAPIGKKCEENGMELLLWFEPERARTGSAIEREHPEWMLRLPQSDGSFHQNNLVNLGESACCDHFIDLIDDIIKQNNVRVYRQDFNFDPKPYWEAAEAADRIGALENLHLQGSLRLWDTLRLRNPGLWIDSCASGGRRNDLETMRRAVPLHYTDVGYGNHPVKQKQHHQMFSWIPYFRAHNMNWDDPVTGEYGKTDHAPDLYSYYVAMTPSLTDCMEFDAAPEAYALARKMHAIWRRAAKLELECDYYPLTPLRKSPEDWCVIQFHNPDTSEGFVELLRNNRCPDETFALRMRALDPKRRYALTEAESGKETLYCGEELLSGVQIRLPARSGRIYFYSAK